MNNKDNKLTNKELWEKYINDELDDDFGYKPENDQPKKQFEIEEKRVKKILFLGTPLIAQYALKNLHNSFDVDVIGVVCQPDREKDRKGDIVFQPTKLFCIENNIKYWQPENIAEIYDEIKDLQIDAIVTCAYGQFIPEKILNLPKYGSFNFHASLLPKYRGGAPIHHAIINQEKYTGWTLMKMTKEMDAGDYYFQMKCEIDKNETYESLYKKLCDLLEPFILFYFNDVFINGTKWTKQNANEVTFGYNITKEDRYLDFNNSTAKELDAKIRGLYDKPVALWNINGKDIKIYKAQVVAADPNENIEPNKIIKFDFDGILVSTKQDYLLIKEIQLPNRSRLEVKQIYHNPIYQQVFK